MRTSVQPEVKILIVDDRPENLLALQAVFRETGYTLIEAHSGKEAFEHAKVHDFACILLDVQMPELDGFETARAIRRLPKTETTPIIFVTAIHRTDEYEQKGYIAGAVDYLFKPIDTKILTAKVGVFVDLFQKTEELKRQKLLLEEALEKSREADHLKNALRSRDEFLMMASHELKTPITPLSLNMQTLLELVEHDSLLNIDRDKLLRMFQTSMAQVDRLSRLIHDLLDVSKLSVNKLEINRGSANLNLIVRKVIEDFEPEIKRSGSIVMLDDLSDVKGTWDAYRIEQVVINLLTNAIKYGMGMPITITIRQSEMAELTVTDHGIGVSAEDHIRIFDRYERAVSSENFSGFGLGLYISRQIVQLHGGTIQVESSPEKKQTSFIVKLPV